MVIIDSRTGKPVTEIGASHENQIIVIRMCIRKIREMAREAEAKKIQELQSASSL